MKILIVDDEVRLSALLSESLGLYGYETRTATTRDEAVNALRNGFVDIVLADVLMPGWTGLELLEMVKKESPKSVVIMMTGMLVDGELIDKLKEKGAALCIKKPFSVSDLTVEIQKLCGNRDNGNQKSQ